jgi:hypothetical protein
VVVSEAEKRRERVYRVVDVLQRAQCLNTVIVSWKEVPRRKEEEEEGGAWEVRENVLSSLERLKGVRFLVGDCIGTAIVEAGIDRFVKALDSRSEARSPISFGVDDVGSSSKRERAAVMIPTCASPRRVANKPIQTIFPARVGQYLRTPQEQDRKRSYFD